MIEIRQTELYAKWFAKLHGRQARARIDVRIRRLSLGNPGDVKPVGEGVSEFALTMVLDIESISCSVGQL